MRDLTAVGLKAETVPANDDVNPPGTVFDQDPKPGVELDRNDTVRIRVSLGPVPVEVPDVRNRKVDSATDLLTERGFQVRVVQQPDDEVPVDTVLDQNPKPGGTAPRGSTITLTVSSGR